MHSSQNEQDTRHYARFAKIPILEPSDSQEACGFVGLGLDISEKFQTPVILRTTTRISHSRSIVSLADRINRPSPSGFVKNPPRFVPIPVWARGMRRNLEDRLPKLVAAACESQANRIELRDTSVGIITSSVAYQYVRDIWPEASVLKLGWAYPFPDDLIRRFAAQVKRILVVEELDDFLEEHIKALGLPCDGRNFVPGIGELSPTVLRSVRSALSLAYPSGPSAPTHPLAHLPTHSFSPSHGLTVSRCQSDLPSRPPVLCPGCPHRGIFYALAQFDVVVTGDIGCYSLGVLPPLGCMDTILCMGAGVSMTQGFEKGGEPKRVVGIVGDSTFFHSGITGLLNIAYNRGSSVIIVVDNRITAMTGHQPNPGSGETLMGEPAPTASIEAIASACGVKRVITVNPYDLLPTIQTLKESLAAKEPTVIVSRAPCPLNEGKPVGETLAINPDQCEQCRECLSLGCPAIEWDEANGIRINDILCGGCDMCKQTCPFDAISPVTA
jgi:indolepyruvate ferredoxin oxidoreductase alpha subunit